MSNTKGSQHKIGRLIDFAALSAWLIVCVSMAVIAYAQFGQDFRGYYAAASVLLDGGNPYDYSLVAQILLEETGRIGNNPFYYPLWFGWIISPLALFPYQIARAVWMLLNLIIWIFSLYRLQQLLKWPGKGWPAWSINLLATIIFGWMTWKFEQTGILLFALTVEILISHRRQQWNLLGILLAAALIKPNIMFVPVAIISLWLIRNKLYQPVIIMSILLMALVLATTLLTPNWHLPLLEPNFGQGLTEVLDGPSKTTGVRLNSTMPDWLKMLQVPEVTRTIIYGLGVVICVILAAMFIWKSRSFIEVTAISLLINFAITPYALQYDFAPMTVALIWALALAAHKKSLKVPVFLVTFITSVLVWERPISDGYWIVIGLSILTYWSLRLYKDSEYPKSLA